MNYKTQIIDSFKSSDIKRVLVVDDAYDVPDLEDYAGALVDILQGSEFRQFVSEDSLSEHNRKSAISVLRQGEDYDDASVQNAVSSLYEAYIKVRDNAIDPAERFSYSKGADLEGMDPLLCLLNQCGESLSVQCVGKLTAREACQQTQPDLLFMDFYLSPDDRVDGTTNDSEDQEDRERSVNLLRQMLEHDCDEIPAVILMSVRQAEEFAQSYRGDLEGKVTRLRFGFFDKKWVVQTGNELSVSADAADVLIDTSGSFSFGRDLESALRGWKDGAEEGLKQLYKELREFDLKDFAYLLRFRLYEESVPFADYLEWFLGESLRAEVDNQVDWSASEFSNLNDRKLTESIRGADPMPSQRMGRSYDRIRFSHTHVNRVRHRFCFGDVFLDPEKNDVRMVITPDCDLVSRENNERNAKTLMTVGGTIHGMNENRVYADNLVYLDDTINSIEWHIKDLMSHKFGDISRIKVNATEYEYFASMRTIPAQSVQKLVLGDLARVGLAVPPTVYVVAPVKIFVKMADKKNPWFKLESLEDARAQVFIPRGGSDRKMFALFTTRFVRSLVARLGEINKDDLSREHQTHLKNWINQVEKVEEKMLEEGIELPNKGIFNMYASTESKNRKHWLNLVVNISYEDRNVLESSDPPAQ